MRQQSLFDTALHAPSDLWLERLASYFDVLGATKSFAKAIEDARGDVSHIPQDQEWGKPYERALIARLKKPATINKISAEVAVLSKKRGIEQLQGVIIEALSGERPPADIWVEFITSSGPVGVPVNVKTPRNALAAGDNGLSLAAFVHWAVDPDFDIRTYGAAHGSTATMDELIVRWLRDDLPLVKNRDYYFLNVYKQPDAARFGFVGAFSSVTSTGLVMARRHGSRDVVRVSCRAAQLLPPDYPISRKLAIAMLPKRGLDQLRISAIGAIAQLGDDLDGTIKHFATMSDEELLHRLLK